MENNFLNFDIVWRPLKPTKRDPDPYRDWLEELIANKQDMEGFDAGEEVAMYLILECQDS